MRNTDLFGLLYVFPYPGKFNGEYGSALLHKCKHLFYMRYGQSKLMHNPHDIKAPFSFACLNHHQERSENKVLYDLHALVAGF